MCGSKKPKPPPMLPEAPRLPDVTKDAFGGDKNKRRRMAASNTILTSSRGDTSAASTNKTLLGA